MRRWKLPTSDQSMEVRMAVCRRRRGGNRGGRRRRGRRMSRWRGRQGNPPAVVALERVGDRARRASGWWRARRGRRRSPSRTSYGVCLGRYLLPLLDVVVRARVAGERHAAELPQPRPVARVHPAVRRDHAGVLARLEQRQRVVDPGLVSRCGGALRGAPRRLRIALSPTSFARSSNVWSIWRQ